ncbi:MAG: AAA family ATPase [Lachnospiraceae bacterium]|nr:AAA family ATPase [Lachnospiraceae bacterium]
MGSYINPGNEGFATIRRSKYVDKTGLISEVNKKIDTKEKLFCISRPRRFGKSFAAQMLCAYYDRTCDSSELFKDFRIARDASYIEHLNKYNVICLDMTDIIGNSSCKDAVAYIKRKLSEEITELCPDIKEEALTDMLVNAVHKTGRKFIAVIDEWDAIIRDSSAAAEEQKAFLEFLRTLFKSSVKTDRIFAAAYMTGILPIKKDGSQSAVSEFQEYNMLDAGELAEFVGFTEEEVRTLCEENSAVFSEMKKWYDGYSMPEIGSVYNPNSVMSAVKKNDFKSYWKMSSAADSLLQYVNMDYDGLSKAVERLMAGIEISVDTDGFNNDVRSVYSMDDVLTLLIHFGYLSYNNLTGTARIPNEEIRLEFARSIRKTSHKDTLERVKESDRLIEDTICLRSEAVARQIEKIHSEEYGPLHYNNEQSLRAVIKLAYFAYKDLYIQFEELSGGTGYADIVYFPKKGKDVPALLVELKWNESAEGAIAQIKKRNYPASIKDYGGELLLVGIAYDKDSAEKKHECIIERVSSVR